ncbi:MAG: hypothetical protein CL933_23955 [Deltaproteobacteria bacterium]|nr:hypothetical protein [Deltaproteobacteria bacterium]
MSETAPPKKSRLAAANVGPGANSSDGAGSTLDWQDGFRLENLVRLTIILLQFGLVILLLREFQLQSKVFLYLLVIAWSGFIVHHFLPRDWKMPFFVVLSLGTIGYVVGLVSALSLVAVGSGLIGLAHIPVPYFVRISLIIAAGAALAYMRTMPDAIPALAPVWPILGSMFMFRMIIYLYDLKHRAAPVSPARAFAYFFMLPNVLFPLFPVVDYKTFCRTYLSADSFEIYQKGTRWMLRGVVHLLLYRLIYQNFMIDVTEVVSGGTAALFMATTFLRYLQVSGSFNLVIGLLCLFGFNLPETFNKYLLASSFTDLWRRINVYWKDFMQKVFYNPMLFWMKRRIGDTGALFVAATWTFFATWALHEYQTFWISGFFPGKMQDIAFWSFLGLMILGNMYIEQRFGRKRKSLSQVKRTLGEDILLALRTVTMFSVFVTAWALWSADSIADWVKLISTFGHSSGLEIVTIFGCLSVLGLGAVIEAHAPRNKPLASLRLGTPLEPMRFWRPAAIGVATSLALLALTHRPIISRFPSDLAAMSTKLTSRALNVADAKMLERGYYENLIDVAKFNPELAELYKERPPDWNTNPTIRLQEEGSFPPYDLHPSLTVVYKGEELSTNSLGLRDREYEREKPAGTVRIVILGASHTVGVGVKDDETYENLLEDRLNRESSDGTRYEVMNFAVSGYGPTCRLATFEDKVLAFDPDVVMSVGIDDVNWVAIELGNAISKSRPMPYDYLARRVEEAGIEPGVASVIAEEKMRPIREDMLRWVYERMGALGTESGITVLQTFLPRAGDYSDERELLDRQTELAVEARLPVIDTSTAYDSAQDKHSLWIENWDNHPNPQGHILLAEAVHRVLTPWLPHPDAESSPSVSEAANTLE